MKIAAINQILFYCLLYSVNLATPINKYNYPNPANSNAIYRIKGPSPNDPLNLIIKMHSE